MKWTGGVKIKERRRYLHPSLRPPQGRGKKNRVKIMSPSRPPPETRSPGAQTHLKHATRFAGTRQLHIPAHGPGQLARDGQAKA
jgi:hypothetical protein